MDRNREASSGQPNAGAFVGRERELAELGGGLDDTLAGRGRVFLIAGEPGIGKTRLAEELGSVATARGAHVLWGRCWEGGGAPAYWPWVQVLRTLLGADQTRALAAPTEVDRLAQIVPDLREQLGLPIRPPATPLEVEQARFPLFDAATTFLRRIALHRPLLIVLDDLHAADPPSLLLMQFVVRELSHAPLLLIGTYRPLEIERTPERAHILNQVARHGHRLPLAGLRETDVARLIENAPGLGSSPELVAAVYRTTEGNPFFVDEVLRLFIAEGQRQLQPGGGLGPLHIPHGVREAIRERFGPLSAGCRQTLGVASCIGREFDLACLERVCGLAVEPLLDVLNEAIASGILAAVPGIIACYSFSHALFRETLYEELPPAQRLRLHRCSGEAIEQLYAHHIEPHLAELAHHFLQASAGGDVDKAIDYATKAGDFAATQIAYEDAAAHYQRALQGLDRSAAAQDQRRCELLLALGRVQRATSDPSARDTFARAAELARRLVQAGTAQATEQLARAALGVADRGIGTPQQAPDHAVVGLVEQALTAIGDGDSTLRARLLGRLAMECSFAEDGDQGVVFSQQAVDMARRLDDLPTLAMTLSNRQFVLWRVDNISDRISISSEIVRLADRIGDKELAVQGRAWRLIDLMGIGDTHTFDSELDVYARCVEELRQPRYLWLTANLRAMRALWAGHWQEAETSAQQALALGETTGDQLAAISPWVQIFVARREQSQLAELETAAKLAVERYPNSPVPRTLLAIIYHDLGRLAEAREQFELLAAENFANLRRERRVGVLPYLSELCAAFADTVRAPVLYELLSPYAHGIVPYGAAICFGAAAHYMALLAAALSRLDTAREHFEYALALHTRTAAAPWLAHTAYAYARFLLDADDPGAHRRAAQLAEQSLAGARALEMSALRDRATALIEQVRHARPGVQDEARRARAYAGGGVQDLPRDPALLHPADPTERERNGKGGRVLTFPTKKPGPGGAALHKSVYAERESPRPATGPTNPVEEGGIFRLDGEYWSVGDSTGTLRLKDTKGLGYIAVLLRYPGHEFHATDLVADERLPAGSRAAIDLAPMDAEQLAGAGLSTDSGEANAPLLDAQAKAAYKRRLADLREDLEEATRFNDVERAAHARAEIDFLTQELARAVGLGGRDRPASSHAERTRLNVTRAIKAVIKRVSDRNPRLGSYLGTTIKTGAFCSYVPDPRLPIQWKL